MFLLVSEQTMTTESSEIRTTTSDVRTTQPQPTTMHPEQTTANGKRSCTYHDALSLYTHLGSTCMDEFVGVNSVHYTQGVLILYNKLSAPTLIVSLPQGYMYYNIPLK